MKKADNSYGLNIAMLVFNSLNPDPRVWKEAKCLADNGHNVIIYAEKNEGLEDISVYENVRIERIFSPNIDSVCPWKNIPCWFSFCCFVFNKKRKKCDVYHCNDAETLIFGYLLSKKDKAVMIYDAHEYFSDYIPSNNQFLKELKPRISNKLKLFFERCFISKCKAIITVSEGIADLLKSGYKLASRPLVLRNTISYERVPYSKKKLQDIIAIGNDKRLIIFHGTISEDREIKRIINILPMLGDLNVMLVLMGKIDKNYKINLISLSDKLGVRNRIMFCEVKYNEVLEYLSCANIEVYLVKPKTLSYKYSMPNKLFEAMAAGLPIVIDKEFVEMRKIVEKYKVGIAVDSDNERESAKAIKTLLENEDYYLSLKDNIKKTRNELCWENDSKKLISLYRAIKD